MVRVYAKSVVALMANEHSVWYATFVNCKIMTVCHKHWINPGHSAVTPASAFRPDPIPASRFAVYLMKFAHQNYLRC